MREREVQGVDKRWQGNIVVKDTGLTLPQSVFWQRSWLNLTTHVYAQAAHAHNRVTF